MRQSVCTQSDKTQVFPGGDHDEFLAGLVAVELSLLSFDTAGKRCATLPACMSLTLSLIRPKPPKTSKTKKFFLFLLFYIGCDRTRRIRCCCAALSCCGRQMRSQLPLNWPTPKKNSRTDQKMFLGFGVADQKTEDETRRTPCCSVLVRHLQNA